MSYLVSPLYEMQSYENQLFTTSQNVVSGHFPLENYMYDSLLLLFFLGLGYGLKFGLGVGTGVGSDDH